MIKYDENSLNSEQKKALDATEGIVLVTAGAGSGKTRLLTHRVAYLIEKKGVDPKRILAITFTNKACKEMKERLRDMGVCDVLISTFHSLCLRILRKEIYNIPPYNENFTIYNENDQEKVLKQVYQSLSLDNEKDEWLRKDIEYYLSAWKNSGISFNVFFSELINQKVNGANDIINAISEYESILQNNNALDFDDLLLKTLELFDTFPEILHAYSNRYMYTLVDEFQDTSLVQYELVKRLISVHKNLFVVGDEDQCIYSWRGANFRNIFNLCNDFEDVKVFKLERNYRSTKNILEMANKVIKNNSERLDKKLWTENFDGELPTVYKATNEKEEARFVAKQIQKFVSIGYHYNDIAVLMRANSLSRNFEEAFLEAKIPHRIYGGYKFYDRSEIKNIISYLRIFVNPKDQISLLKIINFPRRGIGETTIEKLQNNAKELNMTILDMLVAGKVNDKKIETKLEKFTQNVKKMQKECEKLDIYQFVKKVINVFEIEDFYKSRGAEDEEKLENIDSFLSSVKEFKDKGEKVSLKDFLENITLQSDTDDIKEKGAVNIATIHSVKGLEFKVVFIVGLEEQIFPSKHAYDRADMEEERRLMYVALTRAEEFLYLTYVERRFMYGKSSMQNPSRFLKELGLVKPTISIYDKLGTSKIEKDIDKTIDKISKFKPFQKVFHPKYGYGKITQISDDGLVADIEFEDFGQKSLMLEFAPLEIEE